MSGSAGSGSDDGGDGPDRHVPKVLVAPRVAPRQRRSRAAGIGIVVVLALLAAGAFGARQLLGGDDDSGSTSFAGGADSSSASASDPSSLSGLPYDTWVAQLESVSKSDGQGQLDAVLAQVRTQVSDVAVLDSDLVPSMRTGYWVVYAPGPFSTGMDVVGFCDTHGLVMPGHCLGRFLASVASADVETERCYREDGAYSAGCGR